MKRYGAKEGSCQFAAGIKARGFVEVCDSGLGGHTELWKKQSEYIIFNGSPCSGDWWEVWEFAEEEILAAIEVVEEIDRVDRHNGYELGDPTRIIEFLEKEVQK